MKILSLKEQLENERKKNGELRFENIRNKSQIDYLAMMCDVELESSSVMRMSLESAKYQKVKSYYVNQLWDIVQVQNAVEKGWITQEEFEKIIS